MELIDTHAHLDDEQFESQHELLVHRAREAAVVSLIAIGTTASSSQRCIELAGRYPAVFAAVGIQPNYAAEAAADDWSTVVRLARQPKVVALGETGLDRYWDFTPFAVQQDYFDRHLRLAQQTGLPLVIHMRDCLEEMLQMLRDARRRGPLRGVMHSYTGDIQGAAACVELGLHISFAGMVTYKKSAELRAVAVTVPADRILIETDSPYLSPEPRRSVRPNEPALLVHTAGCLAQARGESIGSICRANNAERASVVRPGYDRGDIVPCSLRNHTGRFFAIGVVIDVCLLGRPYGRICVEVSREPVSIDTARILRHAADDDWRVGSPKRVVVDQDSRAGDVRAVLAVATAVHVEAMTERRSQFQIVSGFIAAPGTPRAGDRVAIEVEEIAFNQRSCRIVYNSIAEPVVLAMMDEVVVNMMSVTLPQADPRVAEAGDFAVVDFQLIVLGQDAILRGELVDRTHWLLPRSFHHRPEWM